MSEEGKFVYILFEERLLSTDIDYQDDGFLIIDDCEEVGRNLTAPQLIIYLQKNRPDEYKKLSEKFGCVEDSVVLDADVEEMVEFMNEETEGVMHGFHYQELEFIKFIYDDEETANKQLEYYSQSHSYKNKHRLGKFRVLEKK